MKTNTLNKNRIIKSRDFVCKDKLRIKKDLVIYHYIKIWGDLKKAVIFKFNKYMYIFIKLLKSEGKRTRFAIPILGDAY